MVHVENEINAQISQLNSLLITVREIDPANKEASARIRVAQQQLARLEKKQREQWAKQEGGSVVGHALPHNPTVSTLQQKILLVTV